MMLLNVSSSPRPVCLGVETWWTWRPGSGSRYSSPAEKSCVSSSPVPSSGSVSPAPSGSSWQSSPSTSSAAPVSPTSQSRCPYTGKAAASQSQSAGAWPCSPWTWPWRTGMVPRRRMCRWIPMEDQLDLPEVQSITCLSELSMRFHCIQNCFLYQPS